MLMTASLTTTDAAYIDLVKRAVLDSLYTQDEYVQTTGYGRLLPYIRRHELWSWKCAVVLGSL